MVILTTAAARRHLLLPPHTRFALAMLCADVLAVVAIQSVSDGSPALALALFLIPMSAGFQLQVRRAAVIAAVCLSVYLFLLGADERLRARTADEHIFAVLVFLVLACLACLAVSRQYQDRQGRISQLICERAQLLAEVMSAEERERAALAELLHDGPLQSVLAVRLELGIVQRNVVEGDIEIARRRLLDISVQLRDLTAALHPLMLEAKGIGHVLELLVNSTAERASLEGSSTVTVRHDTDNPDPRENVVFTTARELLNNVVQHANATRFSVSLREKDEMWHLEVHDNGCGIAPGEVRSKLLEGHIGLASLRVRLEAAHGTMAIDSGPRGTSVMITLPPFTPEDFSATSPLSRERGLGRRRR
ncbi:sensor histidine kinase [Streptomyces sp. NPDC057910]|uniref:sensor histidine kinase n=1 Tax=Streptomyces sp. NPDC057910 TaxID=3346278 RepID=UPI0036EF26BE